MKILKWLASAGFALLTAVPVSIYVGLILFFGSRGSDTAAVLIAIFALVPMCLMTFGLGVVALAAFISSSEK